MDSKYATSYTRYGLTKYIINRTPEEIIIGLNKYLNLWGSLNSYIQMREVL